MAKPVWTVRVVVPPNSTLTPQLPPVWVEQLRHMGYMRELTLIPSMLTPEERLCQERGDPIRVIYEFYYPNPRGIDLKAWAEGEAYRLYSFGFNAVAAPKWGG